MKRKFKVFAAILAAGVVLGMSGCHSSTDGNVETAATPEFSVASGEVRSGTTVTLSCTTEGASIYYTLDKSTPTSSSNKYTSAISITEDVTIKAIAVKDGMYDSEVATVTYTVKDAAAVPEFSAASGTVSSGTSVTLSCTTEGAVIYYTLDESTPTSSSTQYTSAISITETVTIKAIAVKDGMYDSDIATVTYTVIDYSACVVGDFILKDGSIVSKDAELTETQIANVAAVIVIAATDSTSAVGASIVNNQQLAWCADSASGYNKSISALEGEYKYLLQDGSTSWSLLQAACSDATEENASSKYPAWNFCLTYGTENNLADSIKDGWYLPAVTEFRNINSNISTINTSFSKVNSSTMSRDFWTCNQYTGGSYNYAYYQNPGSTDQTSSPKDSELYVCAFRVFN